MSQKNIVQGSFKELVLEPGFSLLKLANDGPDTEVFCRDIDSSFIQLHFCLKGRAVFIFNQGRYTLELGEDFSLLLYNTQLDLPLQTELEPNSWVVSIVISIRRFHSLFSKEAELIPFLDTGSPEKKYYSQEPISPAIAVVLSQLMNQNLHESVEELFARAKVYELIALYFNKGSDTDVEQCPFLVDEDNVRRIRKAKEIVITRMADPPTLAELAQEIGLPLKKLKEGFKQIYGDSVYSFLFDYKMEHARRLLESGRHNVNEVAHKVGYSTASHFITGFKKKFGTTPKKYIQPN